MSDANLQSNPNPSSIGLPPLSFNRLSADEVAVRSLDQVFNSRLSSGKYISYPMYSSPLTQPLKQLRDQHLEGLQVILIGLGCMRVRLCYMLSNHYSDLFNRSISR